MHPQLPDTDVMRVREALAQVMADIETDHDHVGA